MSNIFNYITVVSAVIMVILILLQTRGASLGAGFGGSSEVDTVRRGADRGIFQLTIVVAVVFVLSIIFGIIGYIW